MYGAGNCWLRFSRSICLHFFCLIYYAFHYLIKLLITNYSLQYWKSIIISVICENLSLIIIKINSFREILSEKLKILQGMFRLIKAFCQPPISANFGCCYCISFDIACKELKITIIVQNDLFFPQLLTLIVLTVTSSLGYLYVSGKK